MFKTLSTSDGVVKGLNTTFRKTFPVSPKMVTNVDVKKRYLQSISDSGLVPGNFIKNIVRMVEKEKIIPVACTPDYIKALNKHLKGEACMNPKDYQNVLGFYTGKQNRLYILMDNVQRILGDNDKALAFVTVHEMQHMCCYNYMKEFINLWQKELYQFYAHFIALLYKSYTSGFKSMWNAVSGKDKEVIQKLLNPDNGVKYLVQYLIYNHEYLYCCSGANISTSDCKAVGEKVAMLLEQNGCDKKIADTMSKKIAAMIYDVFSGSIGRTYKNEDNYTIISCFRSAYVKVFKKDPWADGTLIYQEIVFPSEIVAISSRYYPKNAKYYQLCNFF